jgi:phenylalanyl-tRNA synthetase beta chain
MRVPLSWLREFVAIDLPAEELARRLTLSGMEVAAIDVIGQDGAVLPWDPALVLICNILEVRQHPNADKLVVADVDYGAAAPHTVVTGAPNLYRYKGLGRLEHPLKAVFAREGARLYDGHSEEKVIVTLKGRPVRGIMSDAMLCSEKELGISDEHEGILFLPDDAPAGMPLRDYLGETVLELEFTPNYARCLSIVGMAREVAAVTGAALTLPDPQLQAAGPSINGRAAVTIDDPVGCPRFTVGLAENVTIGESPFWMQRRLINAGMRPINVVVDISNYVMLEWGQPTHAFDADRVQDRHLVVRRAQAGETLVTLDDRERELTAGRNGLTHTPLLVCDPAGPLGLAGVMGGASSEVRSDSRNILFEAAIWEPTQIRKTARAYKLPSEASRRFERGVDWELPLIAQRRALELIREYTGAVIAADFIDVYPQPWQPLQLTLSCAEVRRIVGIDLTAEDLAALLSRVHFDCRINGEAVEVSVPSHRLDVAGTADLCEEVARIYGYEQIPATRLADELPPPINQPELEREAETRDLMVSSGFSEVITYSLCDMALVARVAPGHADAARYLALSNPSNPEHVYLRRSLLPSIGAALATNLRERGRSTIFEIGRVYLKRDDGAESGRWLPEEPRRLAVALAGPRYDEHWNSAVSGEYDFYDIKGLVEELAARLGLSARISFAPLTDDERFHPGRAATLTLHKPTTNPFGPRPSGKVVGVLGEVHPRVRKALDIALPRVVMAEIDLDALIAAAGQAAYRAISRFPATSQDLSLTVDTAVSNAQIELVIRRSAGELLEDLVLFDQYSGPQVGEGRRSLTYHLRFRAADRTLSDDVLAKLRKKIIGSLERDVKATLRG